MRGRVESLNHSGEDGVCGIAGGAAFEQQRPRWPSDFMWPITGSMADRRRSSRLMAPKTPRFCPEMKTRRGFCASCPRYPLSNIGALDLAAGELLGVLDDVPQGVTVIWVARSALACSTNLAAGSTGIGGDD